MANKTSIEWTDVTWNPVPSRPGYMASSDGQVQGPSGRVLRPMRDRGGYLYVFTYTGGRATMRKLWVHRAVLEAFVGPQPGGCEARHLDGNPANNLLDNLAWGTALENAADKRAHGTQPRGEHVASAKLTEQDVLEIRRLHGTVSLRALARRFGVSHTAIRRAALGIKWGHING